MHLFTHPPSVTLGTYGLGPFRLPVRLPVADLTRHMHLTGTTASGKSRLMAHIVVELILRGEAVTFLDPHGDAVRLVFTTLIAKGLYADPAMYDRVTYLDVPAATAVGRYMPFNVLDQPNDIPTTARLVLEALRRAFPSLDGGVAPAFENAVLAGVSVLRHHNLPIVFLHDLYTDAAWRTQLLAPITDPTVRGFFARLEKWSSREQSQYLESTLRRAFLLGFSPVLRYSLGQQGNILSPFRDRMDARQSLLVNLALPDPDARRLLGSFLTVFAEQAALSRADTPPEQRGPNHTLILDEAASLISQSGTALQHVLEECRKYGLGLVLGNQSDGQLPERVRVALGNVGTEVAFRLSRADAEGAARRLGSVHPDAPRHGAGTHAAYKPLNEQWEEWVATIAHLKPRQFFVRRPMHRRPLTGRYHGDTAKLRTPDMPDSVVDPVVVSRIEDRYLMDCFTVRPLVEAELASRRPIMTPQQTTRRSRLSVD